MRTPRGRGLPALLLAAWFLHPPATGAQETARVAVAGGTLTEIVHALGLAERLVGVDTTSTFPAATAVLPKLGYQRTLSAEGVLALRPDLLLAAAEAGPPQALHQIRLGRVRVETIAAPDTPEGVAAKIAGVAAALGATERAEALLRRFWPAWRAARAETEQYPRHPRVLFILAHGGGGVLTGGRGTAAEAMIRLAGGINAGDGTEGYQPLTTESVVLARPEVLLVTREGVGQLGGLEALWKHPAVRLTPAGRARRAVVMDSLYLLGFGPRLPQAVRELALRLREGDSA